MVIKALKAFTLCNAVSGDLLSIACGGIATVDSTLGGKLITDGLAEEYSPLVPEGTKSITANGTYDVTQYASASVAVAPSLHVAVVPVTDDTDLLGKTADDLQDNIEVGDGAISGELLYVTGYTGFSGDPAEQSGNYIAIKCTADAGSTITVELVNGTLGHPVTLDSDGIIVIRISNKATQTIEVIATKDEMSQKQTFTLTGLTLDAA